MTVQVLCIHGGGGHLTFSLVKVCSPKGRTEGLMNGPLLIVWDPSELNFLTKYSHLK